MPIEKTRTFRSGGSEAVYLPDGVAFGANVELNVVRSGDVVTLYPSYPSAMSIPEMLARLDKMPAPPVVEKRDDEVPPERAPDSP